MEVVHGGGSLIIEFSIDLEMQLFCFCFNKFWDDQGMGQRGSSYLWYLFNSSSITLRSMERIGVDEIFRNNRNFQLIKKKCRN
jgi:hypothetical protein